MKRIKDLKIAFKKENFDMKKVGDFFFDFFLKHSGSIFMLFFVLISGFSFLLIYRYLYSSVWTEDERGAYLQEIRKGAVEFNEDSFGDVVEKIKVRRDKHEEERSFDVRDIFGLQK